MFSKLSLTHLPTKKFYQIMILIIPIMQWSTTGKVFSGAQRIACGDRMRNDMAKFVADEVTKSDIFSFKRNVLELNSDINVNVEIPSGSTVVHIEMEKFRVFLFHEKNREQYLKAKQQIK